MSAEQDIEALLAYAANQAASLSNKADALIAGAVNAATSPVGFTLPGTTAAVGDYSKPFLAETTSPPLGFPVWPTIALEVAPATQGLPDVLHSVESLAKIKVNLPDFNYVTPSAPAAFFGAAPKTPATPAFPEAPSAESPFTPTFLESASLTSFTFDLVSAELIEIKSSFDDIKPEEIYNTTLNQIEARIGGAQGAGPVITEIESQARLLGDTLIPTVCDFMTTRLSEKWTPVWAKQDELRERLTTRLVEEKARVQSALQERSGWLTPQAVIGARSALIDQIASAWAAYAEEQTDIQAVQDALEIFEACGLLSQTIITYIQQLKTKEVELILDAHKAALIYAKQTVAALLKKHEALLKTVELKSQIEGAKLKRYEIELKIALAEFELARRKFQAEEDANIDLNSVKVKELAAEMTNQQQAARRVAALMEASQAELAFLQIPVDIFGLEVKQFNAEIDAQEAKVLGLVAEIEGDEAKVSGQLKRVEGYETEITGFQQMIAAKKAVIAAQSTRNQGCIDEYSLRVDAELAPLIKEIMQKTYAVKVYEYQTDDLLQKLRLEMEYEKFVAEYREKQLEGQLETQEYTQKINFEHKKTNLDRIKAIAEVNLDGAGTMAEMARGAMSAINAVASAVYSEET